MGGLRLWRVERAVIVGGGAEGVGMVWCGKCPLTSPVCRAGVVGSQEAWLRLWGGGAEVMGGRLWSWGVGGGGGEVGVEAEDAAGRGAGAGLPRPSSCPPKGWV